MFLLWFLQSCTAGKTQWKVQLSVDGEELFFPGTHAEGFARRAGQSGSPPEHRQGVNAESATHPRAARFPGFSEWSLLELKGCSWGGGYKFTRGYLAPDSLHKSTSKSEQTFFFFFFSFFCLPQAMNFWTLLLRVEIWQDSRGLLICISLICTAHNSHKHTQSKHVSPYFSEKI